MKAPSRQSQLLPHCRANILKHKRRRRWKDRNVGNLFCDWQKLVLLIHAYTERSHSFCVQNIVFGKTDYGCFHDRVHQWQPHMFPLEQSREKWQLTSHWWGAWENWTRKKPMHWKPPSFDICPYPLASTGQPNQIFWIDGILVRHYFHSPWKSWTVWKYLVTAWATSLPWEPLKGKVGQKWYTLRVKRCFRARSNTIHISQAKFQLSAMENVSNVSPRLILSCAFGEV